jgi:recombination protein RecT
MSEQLDFKKAAQGAVTSFQGAKMSEIKASFDRYKEVISQVAPKKAIDVERVIGIAAHLVSSNEALKKCSPASVIGAIIQCAMTGMNPSPQYGEVYFVPYGQQLQMQMGYRGWAKLAHKSGIIQSISAFAVYEGDQFSYQLGLNPDIQHTAGENYGDPSKVTHAYAVIELRGGGKRFEVLNRKQIERLRGKSPMQKNGINGAWATDYDQMAKAKAVKQALKLVPMEDEWREIHLMDEALAPSLDDFKRDGSGREVGDFMYPNEVLEVEPQSIETK